MAARLTRLSLTPLSWLYAGGWQTYLLVYRLGLKKALEPHRPVVCIGNLKVGGTGKSPITLYVARVLEELGKEVVIGCSGYGSPRSEGASLAPKGELNPKEWGDEPAMIRSLAPDFPIIVGRARVEAARICQDRFPNAVLLMDDGFQHLPVKKHVSIVLDPPGTNRRCLPAGPYREPYDNRRRASLVLPNGFKAIFRVARLQTTEGEEQNPPRANVLCALANPQRFLEDLRALGVQVHQTHLLPDHDPLDRGNLFDSLEPDLPVIVTAKDWVKLQNRQDRGARQILIARQEACIEPEAEFRAWLARKLDELEEQRPAR